MGLDGVEFIMAVEESFQIAIADEDAAQLLTPGDVVRYVHARAGSQDADVCLEQRAFYRLRRATMTTFAQARSAVRPATRWDELLPRDRRRRNWRLLQRATGMPSWPRLTIWGAIPGRVATVGTTAQYLATHCVGALKLPQEGWSRREIEDVVKGLIHEQLGITEFGWDQEFVKDLGVD